MAITRRQFVGDAALAVIALKPVWRRMRWDPQPWGRLTARPAATVRDPLPAGVHTLSALESRTTVVVVPPGLVPERPAPLILMFHGATESNTESLDAMQQIAERSGAILLAPSSAGRTWDAIRGVFGDDLDDIDKQLARVFAHCVVDPGRIAFAGFSDGASYAISLGLINGDLCSHIIGYSPGFIIPGVWHGHPRVFIAHGTHDHILPIDQCGRRIASDLTKRGYSVQFAEFDGDHEIRPEMVERSVAWVVGGAAATGPRAPGGE
ncbi:MAG: alpha/beta hydrolase [Gemmatimonadales bacterium]|jgi:predicted esterase